MDRPQQPLIMGEERFFFIIFFLRKKMDDELLGKAVNLCIKTVSLHLSHGLYAALDKVGI